nr:NADH dehydrogenase subunit 4 [Craspedonirmus immer]
MVSPMMIVSMSIIALVVKSPETSIFLLSLTTLTALSSPSSEVLSTHLLGDEISNPLISLASWMTLGVLCYTSSENSNGKAFIIKFLYLIFVLFFYAKKVVFFFSMFELSLIPIVMIILGWGSQPERIEAGRFLIFYTIFASVPLLLVTMMVGGVELSLFQPNPLWIDPMPRLDLWGSSVVVFLLMFGFLVKLPMFLCHSWLPKAHVESPLEGSMLLAGVMLKMSVYGMIRLLKILPFFSMPILKSLASGVLLMGCLLAPLVGLASDDLKMAVAYSSISHMNLVMASALTFKITAVYSSVIVMVSHGLCSSVLFYVVTQAYGWSGSRSLIFTKGIGSVFSSFALVSFFFWAMNMSIPPSLPFLGEVLLVVSLLSSIMVAIPLICSFVVFNSVFSMVNFGLACHSSEPLLSKSSSPELKTFMVSSFFAIPLLGGFFSSEWII